ncbi:hypothetical protein SOPP22_18635 [Shewanella sp. OPT22]|nr:hypothetical protein SOPP22_18635 [Shewanella sp. OPT22]
MRYSKFILILFTLLLVNGCNNKKEDDTSTIRGAISDIPLQNAIACLDCNSNFQCDSSEIQTNTDFEGSFVFHDIPSEKALCPLVVETNENTINLSTGDPVGLFYALSAPAGYKHISGVTTLLMHQLSKSGELSLAEKRMSEHLVSRAPMSMMVEQIKTIDLNEAIYRQNSSEVITQGIQVALEMIAAVEHSQTLSMHQKMSIALEAISSSMSLLVDAYVDGVDNSESDALIQRSPNLISSNSVPATFSQSFIDGIRLFLGRNMARERLTLMSRRLSSQSANIGSYISSRGQRFGGIYNYSDTNADGQTKLVYNLTRRPDTRENSALDYSFFETKKFTQNAGEDFEESQSNTILGAVPNMPKTISDGSVRLISSGFRSHGIVNREFNRYQNVRDGYSVGAKVRSYSLNGVQIKAFLNQISPALAELVNQDSRFSEGATGLVLSVVADDDNIPFVPNEPNQIDFYISDSHKVTDSRHPANVQYVFNSCKLNATFHPILNYFTEDESISEAMYSTTTTNVRNGPALFVKNNHAYGTLTTNRNSSKIYKISSIESDRPCSDFATNRLVETSYQLIDGHPSYRIQLDDATKRAYPNRSAATNILLFESILDRRVIIAEQYNFGDSLHVIDYATNQAAFEQILDALVQ